RLWQRGSSLPIYLSRVISNFVVDFHRKKRWRETPVGDPPEPEPHEPEGETAIVLKQLRKVALKAWAKLDSRDRFLICGKFHRELTNETNGRTIEPNGRHPQDSAISRTGKVASKPQNVSAGVFFSISVTQRLQITSYGRASLAWCRVAQFEMTPLL